MADKTNQGLDYRMNYPLTRTVSLLRELAPDRDPIPLLAKAVEHYLGPWVGMTARERIGRLTSVEIEILEESLEERLAIRQADGIVGDPARLVVRAALTVWQPMAWAIAAGHKTVENRSWAPPQRAVGQWIAIHAGKRWHQDHADQIRDLLGIDVPARAALPFGAIVAVARLAGAVREGETGPLADYAASPFFSGPIGWALCEVLPLEPVRCPGAQGLWRLPSVVTAAVERQIGGDK